jgi:hypothetical protein
MKPVEKHLWLVRSGSFKRVWPCTPKCLSSAHSIAAKYISSSGRLRGFIYDYLLNQAAVSYIMMAIKPTSDRPESSWAGEKIQGIKPILYFPVRRHGLTSRPGPIRSRSAKGSLIG